MPTGYTAQITEKGCTFEKFAMSCARAFGACVDLRDSTSKHIPKAFKPSSYHANEVAAAEKKIQWLSGLTSEQAEVLALKEWKQRNKELADSIAETIRERDRYTAMLNKVLAWVPPTPDHVSLKKFMIEQIRETIQHDCNISEYRHEKATMRPLTPAEWVAQEMAEAKEHLKYQQEELAKEIKRTNGNTVWVQALRDSLKK